jgi:hypothetical protein
MRGLRTMKLTRTTIRKRAPGNAARRAVEGVTEVPESDTLGGSPTTRR